MKDDYVEYEYILINVKSELEQIYIDSYKNFGWIHINNEKRDYYINSNPTLDIVEIKFKRNRNIKNKEELKKLQEKCEKAILKVNKLEKMPQSLATIYSLIIGFIAAIFIAISILAIIGKIWFVAIFCGVIGLVGCTFPYFIYKNVKNKKEIENRIKLEEQQNIISDAFKKARKILLELE